MSVQENNEVCLSNCLGEEKTAYGGKERLYLEGVRELCPLLDGRTGPWLLGPGLTGAAAVLWEQQPHGI